MAKRIVVADDDPQILKLVRACLERKGYEVLEAQDGDAALATIRQMRPDLVVLDLMLPKVNGWNVGFALRKEAAFQRLPIIVLSGLVEADSGRQEVFDYVDFHMAKPFDTEQFVAKVEELLRDPERGQTPLEGV